MPTRRSVIASGAVLGLALAGLAPRRVAAASSYQPVVTDDGLLAQPWFMQTFLNLADDLQEATQSGKRFAVTWEQKGCPYCKEMHNVNFAKPEIQEYVHANFAIVQLNLHGAREVTDFDGQALEERALAKKWRIRFTPTVLFFPETIAGAKRRPGTDLAIATMPGYFKPFHFLSMFRYVRENAYRDTKFPKFLARRLADLKARGVDPNTW